MSGVLERMAKRARGALPTVEPRTAPRFAPPESGSAGVGTSAFGIEEISSEAESPANRRENTQKKMRRSELDEDKAPREIRETHDAAPVREQVRRATANQASRGMDVDRQRDSQPRLQPKPQANPEPESKQASDSSLKSNDSERGSKEIGIEESHEFTVRAAMTRTPEETTLEPSQIESKIASNRENNRENGEEAETPAIRRNNRVQEREAQAIEVRSAARKEAAMLAPTLDGSAEQRTEIHISIGNIELRAPRVEARLQAAPFRPRVTLDDYLRRKPEAGA
jgi:hypothetical protein